MQPKILVLCHGNVCRSPLAEVALRRHGFDVKSAGFKESGRRAAKKMRECAATRGLDLEEHRSTTVDDELMRWADMVVIMDNGNERRYMAGFSAFAHKMSRLGDYLCPPVSRIKDPGFMKRGPELEAVADQIVQACALLAAHHNTVDTL